MGDSYREELRKTRRRLPPADPAKAAQQEAIQLALRRAGKRAQGPYKRHRTAVPQVKLL